MIYVEEAKMLENIRDGKINKCQDNKRQFQWDKIWKSVRFRK